MKIPRSLIVFMILAILPLIIFYLGKLSLETNIGESFFGLIFLFLALFILIINSPFRDFAFKKFGIYLEHSDFFTVPTDAGLLWAYGMYLIVLLIVAIWHYRKNKIYILPFMVFLIILLPATIFVSNTIKKQELKKQLKDREIANIAELDLTEVKTDEYQKKYSYDQVEQVLAPSLTKKFLYPHNIPFSLVPSNVIYSQEYESLVLFLWINPHVDVYTKTNTPIQHVEIYESYKQKYSNNLAGNGNDPLLPETITKITINGIDWTIGKDSLGVIKAYASTDFGLYFSVVNDYTSKPQFNDSDFKEILKSINLQS